VPESQPLMLYAAVVEQEDGVWVFTGTALKERFLQFMDISRELLSDFREVEQNFRSLDRWVRERIALWEGSKGELLEEIMGERDAITDSDQGRSFRGFWDFLMSSARQAELSDLLERVLSLPAVAELRPDARTRRIHYDWLQAGEHTQRTVAQLSQQLRRFLDDKAWLENRRIMGILRSIEGRSLAVRQTIPGDGFMLIDARSRRGTLVNGQRIEKVVLNPGDVIQAGAVKMLFEFVDDETPGRLASSAPDSDERDAQAFNGGVLTKTRASTPTLVVIDGDDAGRRLPLVGKNQFKVGRSITSDLKLVDGKVSRDHCLIETVRDHHIIVDLESANGTVVNGERIKKTVLQEGDLIRLGYSILKYDRV